MPVLSRLLVLLLVAGLAAPAAAQPAGPTTVLVVRHAEKAAGDDPGLTAAGLERAEALAVVGRDAGATAVYASQYRRTRDTAAPLASALGVETQVRPVSRETVAAYPEALARELLERHRGEVVVVVSHSNLAPALVEALGGAPGPGMPEHEYDRLYVVVVPEAGPVRTVRAAYGARSAAK